MTLESILFEKLTPDENRLKQFGFVKKDDVFLYEKMICEGQMKAVIVSDHGEINGRIFDAFEEEYIAFRLEGVRGEYASYVRSEYLALLEKIAGECCRKTDFASAQANRISHMIEERFSEKPEYVFEKHPDYAVFRYGKKWYGLIMMVQPEQVTGIDDRREILNVKVHPSELDELLKKDGIFPSFHMNRKHWVSIDLNDTLSDKDVFDLVCSSRTMAGGSGDVTQNCWIVPANPSYFDLDHAFTVTDTIYWKQSAKIRPGDLIYMYYGSPYSEIRYLCVAVETDLPFKGVNDGPIHMEKLMRIRKLYFFSDSILNRKMLAEYGVTHVRGPRRMSVELKKEIDRIYHLKGGKHD